MQAARVSPESPMGRRSAVSGLGIATMIAATPGFGIPLKSTVFAGRTRDMWRNAHAVRAVGRRYLSMARDEADRARLSDLVFGEAPPDLSFAGLQRHIAAGRERDFAAGDTVMLDGWILARTEARLCALCSLA